MGEIKDFRPTSEESKIRQGGDNRPRPEKIVSGSVKTKPKTGFAKFKDAFITGDWHHIKEYVCSDVIVPGIKKALFDIVTGGIEMLVYGSTGRKRDRQSRGTVTSYTQYYEDKRFNDRFAERSRTSSTVYNYDDILFNSRGQAEHVLESMCNYLDTYDRVSVADLYDMCGLSCNYTDNDYGWTDLHTAIVRRVNDGFIIDLPKAVSLKGRN